jgi:hypothetical protein
MARLPAEAAELAWFAPPVAAAASTMDLASWVPFGVFIFIISRGGFLVWDPVTARNWRDGWFELRGRSGGVHAAAGGQAAGHGLGWMARYPGPRVGAGWMGIQGEVHGGKRQVGKGGTGHRSGSIRSASCLLVQLVRETIFCRRTGQNRRRTGHEAGISPKSIGPCAGIPVGGLAGNPFPFPTHWATA